MASIRTRGNPFKSKPHPLLTLTSVAVVATALGLPLTLWRTHLGFVAPPLSFYGILAAMVVAYLVIVEVVKRVFYRRALRA